MTKGFGNSHLEVLVVFLALVVVAVTHVQGQDRFHYEEQSDWDQGIMSPSDWDKVQCDDFATCVSQPINL